MREVLWYIPPFYLPSFFPTNFCDVFLHFFFPRFQVISGLVCLKSPFLWCTICYANRMLYSSHDFIWGHPFSKIIVSHSTTIWEEFCNPILMPLMKWSLKKLIVNSSYSRSPKRSFQSLLFSWWRRTIKNLSQNMVGNTHLQLLFEFTSFQQLYI